MTDHNGPTHVPPETHDASDGATDLQHELQREQDYWDRYYISERAERVLEKQLANRLPDYFAREFARAERIYHQPFDRPARVLVLGAGLGTVAVWCADRYPAWDVVSMDLSVEGLRVHGAIGQRMGIPWRGDTLVCDWDHLPFPAETFDFCVADRSLHHMMQPDVSLRAVARALKLGGILIGLREPFLAVSKPEMRTEFAADEKVDGAHDQVWYLGEWRRFFHAAGFDLKARVHLSDVYRFYDGWGPRLPGLRRLTRRLPDDWTARLLFPYVWYYGSTRIAKYTLYAQKTGAQQP